MFAFLFLINDERYLCLLDFCVSASRGGHGPWKTIRKWVGVRAEIIGLPACIPYVQWLGSSNINVLDII